MSWYSLGSMPTKTAILMGADNSSLCFIFSPSTLTSHSVTPFTIPWWFFSAGGLTTSITHCSRLAAVFASYLACNMPMARYPSASQFFSLIPLTTHFASPAVRATIKAYNSPLYLLWFSSSKSPNSNTPLSSTVNFGRSFKSFLKSLASSESIDPIWVSKSKIQLLNFAGFPSNLSTLWKYFVSKMTLFPNPLPSPLPPVPKPVPPWAPPKVACCCACKESMAALICAISVACTRNCSTSCSLLMPAANIFAQSFEGEGNHS